MGISKGEKTKQRIIQKAVKVFAQEGFFRASLQTIAQLADVNKPVIFYYFESKEALLREIIQQIIESNQNQLQAIIDPRDSAETQLMKYFQVHAEWACFQPAEATIIYLLYYFSTFDSEIAHLNQKVLNGARSKIQGFLLAGVREKVFKLSEDEVTEQANFIHTSLVGILVVKLSENTKDPKEFLNSFEKITHQIPKVGKREGSRN